MSIVDVADKIQKKIDELDNLRGLLEESGYQKSVTKAQHERELAKIVIQLKNGVPFKHDDNEVKDPPTTLILNIAKGICWQTSLEADKAEAHYKNVLVQIEVVSSQLNAFQSINRYLDKI